jgi:hypothetical protein
MFLALSLLFFILGAAGKQLFFPSLVLLAALPLGNSLSSLFYAYGFYVYDFYFLALGSSFLFSSLVSKNRLSRQPVVIAIFFCLPYVAIGVNDNGFDKYYLRDLRLVFFLVYIYIFANIRAVGWRLSERKVLVVFGVAATSSIIFGSLFHLGFFSFDDEFYTRQSFRYIALSSFLSATYVTFFFAYKKNSRISILSNVVLALSIVALFFTGLRMLIIFSAAIFIVTNMLSVRKMLAAMLVVFALIIGMESLENSMLVARVGLVDVEVYKTALTNRYGPFFELIKTYSNFNLIAGGGLGTVFDIPWFSHRESKDNYNNFIDSTYLTLFAKFGVFSIVYIYLSIETVVRLMSRNDRKARLYGWIFWLAIFVVYCPPFQMTAVGIIVGFYFIGLREARPPRSTRSESILN